MSRLPFAPALLSLPVAACVLGERTHEQTLPVEGVGRVFCDVDRGSLLYSSSTPGAFDVGVHTWAHGASEAAADHALDSVDWGAAVKGDRLDLWARAHGPRRGTDFTLEGPPRMDLEAVVLDGDVTVYDASGDLVITADTLTIARAAGDLDLLALEGATVDARPTPGAELRIEATGPTQIALPFGLGYDLEAFTDPDWPTKLSPLGFDELDVFPDYIRGTAGAVDIHVEIRVHDGPLTLSPTE